MSNAIRSSRYIHNCLLASQLIRCEAPTPHEIVTDYSNALIGAVIRSFVNVQSESLAGFETIFMKLLVVACSETDGMIVNSNIKTPTEIIRYDLVCLIKDHNVACQYQNRIQVLFK
ncbi:Uncharacterized protein FWK35_00010192 [Aphis craccivora]|uniref:Uncharacterized protein n=1 Tax=Aphis craccivora TaxID=307492 RepID=A0A6G0YB25_APHCR|nr:Uncharacterized protein FWK35_00010192 [Aphis craccivora]